MRWSLDSALNSERQTVVPVGADRCTRKSGTALASIVGESNDEIKIQPGVLLPGIGNRGGGIDLEIFAKNFQDQRVHSPVGVSPAL